MGMQQRHQGLLAKASPAFRKYLATLSPRDQDLLVDALRQQLFHEVPVAFADKHLVTIHVQTRSTVRSRLRKLIAMYLYSIATSEFLIRQSDHCERVVLTSILANYADHRFSPWAKRLVDTQLRKAPALPQARRDDLTQTLARVAGAETMEFIDGRYLQGSCSDERFLAFCREQKVSPATVHLLADGRLCPFLTRLVTVTKQLSSRRRTQDPTPCGSIVSPTHL